MFGMRSRNAISRSHGSSWRNRIEASKVAPPHISRLNSVGTDRDSVSAIASMS
jgi:hypothetical protein